MKHQKIQDNITVIDCNYTARKFACSYLIIEGRKATFVENNTQFAVPLLLDALEEQGLGRDNVENIIITHVHLDHAGGTSMLVRECPNATVLAHERAARHIIDPERIIQGATAVYGEKTFNKLYGIIEPVPENRVYIVKDRETIKFGSREFRFIYTPGHAKHHMCIYDSGSNGIFTGDSFGLAFPVLQKSGRPFIVPTTSPPDFDPDEALKSIDRITETGADKVYLTHYGPLYDIKAGTAVITEALHIMKNILHEAVISGKDSHDLDDFCFTRVNYFIKEEAEKCGIAVNSKSLKILEGDIILNSQGIALAALKKRDEQATV